MTIWKPYLLQVSSSNILRLSTNYSDILFLGNPYRILDEAKNISFNATAAFNAYSNIKDYIDEAEKIAQERIGGKGRNLDSNPDG